MGTRTLVWMIALLIGCVTEVEPVGGDGGEEDNGDGGGSGGGGGGGGATPRGSGGTGGALGNSLGPCPDCRVHVPASYTPGTPMPLLVALHGDEGRDFGRASATQGVINSWKAAADQQGYIVFAPACPASAGCNGAWSDWLAAQSYRLTPATLAWLDAQVDAIEAMYNVELDREMLAGYSGGAYWLGYYAQARGDRFAGVAMVAGGMPAYTANHGCPVCKIPGYFLGGNMDFRTQQMSDTANAFDRCGEEIRTDLIAGGTHQSTIASLGSGKALEILTWLDARPLSCP
ncbi:MAG: hypothetical protein H0T42_04985 [Deltaproteobacteria bacterium]|nr:hypothetical protein [Deltaproteobacteria bacterium]